MDRHLIEEKKNPETLDLSGFPVGAGNVTRTHDLLITKDGRNKRPKSLNNRRKPGMPGIPGFFLFAQYCEKRDGTAKELKNIGVNNGLRVIQG